MVNEAREIFYCLHWIVIIFSTSFFNQKNANGSFGPKTKCLRGSTQCESAAHTTHVISEVHLGSERGVSAGGARAPLALGGGRACGVRVARRLGRGARAPLVEQRRFELDRARAQRRCLVCRARELGTELAAQICFAVTAMW